MLDELPKGMRYLVVGRKNAQGKYVPVSPGKSNAGIHITLDVPFEVINRLAGDTICKSAHAMEAVLLTLPQGQEGGLNVCRGCLKGLAKVKA